MPCAHPANASDPRNALYALGAGWQAPWAPPTCPSDVPNMSPPQPLFLPPATEQQAAPRPHSYATAMPTPQPWPIRSHLSAHPPGQTQVEMYGAARSAPAHAPGGNEQHSHSMHTTGRERGSLELHTPFATGAAMIRQPFWQPVAVPPRECDMECAARKGDVRADDALSRAVMPAGVDASVVQLAHAQSDALNAHQSSPGLFMWHHQGCEDIAPAGSGEQSDLFGSIGTASLMLASDSGACGSMDALAALSSAELLGMDTARLGQLHG